MICRTCLRPLRLGPACPVCQPNADPEPCPGDAMNTVAHWPGPVVAWVRDSLATRHVDTLTDDECVLVRCVRRGWFRPEAHDWLVPMAVRLHAEAVAADQDRQQAEASGSYVGVVGDRCDIPGLRCESVKALGVHPEYGPRFVITFTAPGGATVVWFTGQGKFDPQPGQTYDVKAFVKSHEPFAGVKQTVIQRPKVLTCST